MIFLSVLKLLSCIWFLSVDSPSKITEENSLDDGMVMTGDDLADNSIDDLPGVYDYSYSGGVRECGVNMVLINSLVMVVVTGGAFVGRPVWW